MSKVLHGVRFRNCSTGRPVAGRTEPHQRRFSQSFGFQRVSQPVSGQSKGVSKAVESHGDVSGRSATGGRRWRLAHVLAGVATSSSTYFEYSVSTDSDSAPRALADSTASTPFPRHCNSVQICTYTSQLELLPVPVTFYLRLHISISGCSILQSIGELLKFIFNIYIYGFAYMNKLGNLSIAHNNTQSMIHTTWR